MSHLVSISSHLQMYGSNNQSATVLKSAPLGQLGLICHILRIKAAGSQRMDTSPLFTPTHPG